jgi:putative FmdB family regulatory protein
VFRCRACGERFEELTPPSSDACCPACGAAGPERLFAPISRPLKFGLRGADARRSNAQRGAREERKREERARRRAQRPD